ncbi:glycoside hydrolase [Gymnopus androsaceus JB14]|uniref:Glycoside hydrolase n=1 Tax=Gymnopus androsaceus JB14 TaxID=1447944 RepID=A0A6A4HFB3_9AGAR|nr:glycoside hydrolase [Gymnopus androsaceus JB14]
MGYYTSWNSQILEPEEIDFAIYRCITYAFATLNEALQLSVDSPDLLERLVNAAHAKGTCVILSIGGWDDSAYFSSAVSTSSNRTSFVQQVIELFQNYKLDGFDFDWEYPGQEGKPGNQFNNNDTQNFFAFFQLLRYELPNAIISAAALDTPFVGSDGQPMQDVSPFGEVLDWLTIMNYDVVQSSSTPGPDAPLSDYCHNSTQPQASAAAGVDQWTRAGFPVGKLVLGVPYYGYVSNSNASTLRSRASSPSVRLQGDTDGCMLFRDFVSQGALACNTEECYGSGGFARYWDQCSSTPYLRSEAAKQVVSFDDPESMSMKAQFAKKTGMLGVIAWEIAGDTDKGDLGLAIEHGFSVA